MFFSVIDDQAIKVMINGTFYSFSAYPIIESNRVLVPFRGIASALGAEVNWDDSLKKVTLTLKNKKVEVIIGNDTAQSSGGQIKLDVPAKIINGSTFVPLRFIGESLGAQVNLDTNTRTVIIIAAK